MRIDKFLKNSRIIKRRTVAKEACENGHIMVNGKVAKAGTEIFIGDLVTIEFGSGSQEIKITEIIESPKKQDAQAMYEIVKKR